KADWSDAFGLVPSLECAYVWHASKFTREVLDGLLRIGFLHHQQIIWDKSRTVLTRTHYWFQHEPCWYVRKKNAPWFGKAGENSTIWVSPSPKFIMGGSDEEKYDHPTKKPIELMRRPILNHIKRGELVYEPFLGSGTTLAAAEVTERVCYGIELDPKYVDVVVQRWQQLSGKKALLLGKGCCIGAATRTASSTWIRCADRGTAVHARRACVPGFLLRAVWPEEPAMKSSPAGRTGRARRRPTVGRRTASLGSRANGRGTGFNTW